MPRRPPSGVPPVLLSLDVERRVEGEMWLALTGRLLADPAFRAVSRVHCGEQATPCFHVVL